MATCNISQEDLAEALEIPVKTLLDICNFFESDPNDDWELIEGDHFTWGVHRSRLFSPDGATEICNYLEHNDNIRKFYNRFARWLLQRDRRFKAMMIRSKIEEQSSIKGRIVFRGQRAFLSPRACRDVLGLGTRQDILKKVFKELQRSNETDREVPLIIDQEFFIDDDGSLYLSGSGLSSCCKKLSTTMTQKHRRDLMQIISINSPTILRNIESYESKREQRINKSMQSVKNRANGRCQVSDEIQSVGKFNLEVHHFFDKNNYPQISDQELNLIAIRSDIHVHFHMWMGGTHKSCTIEDFQKYIKEFELTYFKDNDNELERASQLYKKLEMARRALRGMLGD